MMLVNLLNFSKLLCVIQRMFEVVLKNLCLGFVFNIVFIAVHFLIVFIKLIVEDLKIKMHIKNQGKEKDNNKTENSYLSLELQININPQHKQIE